MSRTSMGSIDVVLLPTYTGLATPLSWTGMTAILWSHGSLATQGSDWLVLGILCGPDH
jgi:hypothetical protein